MFVPGQWIAKMYTEALGRGPSRAEWEDALEFFDAKGTDPGTLAGFAAQIYGSIEFAGLGLDAEAAALALCRGLLNREPTVDELARYAAAGDGAFGQIIATDDHARAAAHACGPNPNTYFGIEPVTDRAGAGPGVPSMEGDDLQAIIDETAPGETVWLKRGGVFRLHRPLWVRGQTLATAGLPRHYALMARLLREDDFPTVQPSDRWEGNGTVEVRGGRLACIWVDGRLCRPDRPGFGRPWANINAAPRRGCEIVGCRVSHSRAATSLTAIREIEDPNPATIVIRDNLVDHHSGEHWWPDWREAQWSDGINNHCPHAVIVHNYVIDATDVGIISFFQPNGGVQHSEMSRNVVLQAGNSAYGGMCIDPFFTQEGQGRFDFTGLRVEENLLMAAPNVHFDIGLAIGTRAWFGDRSDMGFGSEWRRNTIVGPVGVGVLVHGVVDLAVQDNVIEVTHSPEASPQFHPVANSAWRGWASGDLQPGDDFEANQCIGHSRMPEWEIPRPEHPPTV